MFAPDNIVGREPDKAITGGKTLNIARRWRRSVWLDRTELSFVQAENSMVLFRKGRFSCGAPGAEALDQSFASSASTSACRRRGVEPAFSGRRHESDTIG